MWENKHTEGDSTWLLCKDNLTCISRPKVIWHTSSYLLIYPPSFRSVTWTLAWILTALQTLTSSLHLGLAVCIVFLKPSIYTAKILARAFIIVVTSTSPYQVQIHTESFCGYQPLSGSCREELIQHVPPLHISLPAPCFLMQI